MSWITPGTKIYGFAGGYFGRDYADKICIETGFYDGVPWAVFHSKESYGPAFHVLHGVEKLEALKQYTKPEEEF